MTNKTLLSAFLGLALAAGLSAVETGKPAPGFSLPGLAGKAVSLEQFKGKTVVLEWINPGCPFVKKHYDNSGNLPALQKQFVGKDLVWLAINSSAAGKEGHWAGAAEAQAYKDAQKAAMSDILLDADGTVGHLYGAKTTPHMYVIDPKGVLVYQGAIDSIASTKAKDIKKATNWVAQALGELKAGKAVSVSDTKPYGCSVKYAK
jgi:hypothetical protein